MGFNLDRIYFDEDDDKINSDQIKIKPENVLIDE